MEDRRRVRIPQLDLGMLASVLLCLPATWPYLSRPGLPLETDAELHVFRLAELTRLIQGGEFYPRWAPNFYYGYGYPIFNYYAPLSYYLGLPFVLLGATPVQAVKIVFIAGIVAGGAFMYLFVRRHWGAAAGLLAAALFVYAPYIHFVDPYARGDLAEAASYGLLPLALLCLDRLQEHVNGWRLVAGALAVAGIILIHNLMALVMFALLIAWVAWQWWLVPVERRRIWPQLLVLFAGVGLAAFFWLPVALERDAVNLGTLIGQGDHFDFRNHFLTLTDLLAPSRRLDWRATEPEFSRNLGLLQWVLGLGGAAIMIRYRRACGRLLASWLFFPAAGALFLLLMLPLSRQLWELVPLLPFLQFPWRLLGPASAMLAISAGAGAGLLLSKATETLGAERFNWGAGLLIGAVLATALPLTQVPPWPADFGPTDARRVVEIELQGRWLGTTSTADFVPVTVEALPLPQDSVLAGLKSGGPVDRIIWETVPSGVHITTEHLKPLSVRYHISADAPFAFRLFLFAFPGWQTWLDNVPVTWKVADPEGFIWLPLPAGDHVLDVAFENTPARQVASWVSIATVVVLFAGAAFAGNRRSEAKLHPPVSDRRMLPLILPFALIVVLQMAWWNPARLLHLESPSMVAIPAENQGIWRFDDELALIGYDAPGKIRAGDAVEVVLYWQAMTVPQQNYQVFVHLLNDQGRPVAQSDKLNPGEYPTKRWPGDRYVRDTHRFVVPDSLPAGEYRLTTGLWQLSTGRRLEITSDQFANDYSDGFVVLEQYDASD